MAQDIQLDFSTANSITITINSVADGSAATSSSFNLGNPAPAELLLHLSLDGLSSGTDYFEAYMLWSHEDVAASYTTTDNAVPVGVVQMNETTAVEAHIMVPVMAQYGKLYVINNSGAAMAASGNTAEYFEVAVDQA